jgi:hypothetical protein
MMLTEEADEKTIAEQDERHRHPGMQELSHKVDRLCVSGFGLEQNPAIALLLQHRLGFLEWACSSSVASRLWVRSSISRIRQKIFLFVAHQQDMQHRWR